MKTIFSLHFSETPASDSFFPSSGTSFQWNIHWERKVETSWLVEMDFLLVETISSVQRFLLLIKTVTAISESHFLRKDHILTNVTDFLANGNQLLPFFQKEVNCCQWKQFLLQLDHRQSSILASGNKLFVN